MKNFFKDKEFIIKNEYKAAFCKDNNVFQDGTTPTYRDVDGKLWAISGHTHMGEIVMFSGTTMKDMQKLYPIKTLFSAGKAGEAYDCHKYPDGVLPRGSIWPFGLYICPTTHRFFVFFHNETGWAGHGTAYDCLGLCDKPLLDSDFRHVGLMHSDDEGKTWEFDRWVLTGERPCLTEKYNPEAGKVVGQKLNDVNLGAGDFSLYIDDEYIYIYYTMLCLDMEKVKAVGLDAYVARTRKRADGIMGDFVKYYNGSFCEAGNFGKETAIAKNTWHPKVVRLEKYGLYMMSSSGFLAGESYFVSDFIRLRSSTDLVNWSEPVNVKKDDKDFGAHYCGFYPDGDGETFVVKDDKMILQLNGNGTDVMGYEVEIIEKRK